MVSVLQEEKWELGKKDGLDEHMYNPLLIKFWGWKQKNLWPDKKFCVFSKKHTNPFHHTVCKKGMSVFARHLWKWLKVCFLYSRLRTV